MLRRLCALLVVATFLSCGPRGAQDSPLVDREPDASGGQESVVDAASEPSWEDTFDSMASALDLSEEEQSALRTALIDREEAVAAWQAEHGEELAKWNRRMKEAVADRDLAGVRRATAEATPLRDDFWELTALHEDRIRQSLTSENRHRWDAHQIAERLLELVRPLDLSDEQTAGIRLAALDAVRASIDEPNPQAAAYLKLEREVERSVLTESQRRAMEEIQREPPLRSLRGSAGR